MINSIFQTGSNDFLIFLRWTVHIRPEPEAYGRNQKPWVAKLPVLHVRLTKHDQKCF